MTTDPVTITIVADTSAFIEAARRAVTEVRDLAHRQELRVRYMRTGYKYLLTAAAWTADPDGLTDALTDARDAYYDAADVMEGLS